MLRRNTPVSVSILCLSLLTAAWVFAGAINIRQAEAAVRGHDYGQAARMYSRASKIFFWRADLQEQAGINAGRGGEYSLAISYFDEANIFTNEGWVWYCTSFIQLEDDLNALRICESGLAAGESSELYSLLAFIYRSQKDWQAERIALEGQTRLDPTDAFAAYRLGLLFILDSSADPIPEWTRASSLNPEADSSIQTLRAALAVSSQEKDLSIQKVIVGQALGLVQEWDLAHSAFEAALRIDEKNAQAWAWLGEANQQTGQEGSAELDKALSIDPASVNVRGLRALHWSRTGEYQKMLAEYAAAANIEPENPRWLAGMGEAYTKLGNLIAALESYQKAASLSPNDAEYWRLLAVFCAESGVQVEEIGLPAAETALALAPDSAPVLDAAGAVYLATGRFANAQAVLEHAIEIDPVYFPARIHLALTYLSQGDRTSAYNALSYVRDAQGAGEYADIAAQLLDKYFQ